MYFNLNLIYLLTRHFSKSRLNSFLFEFFLECQKSESNTTWLLGLANKSLADYKEVVTKFDKETERAKNSSDFALGQVNGLLSNCSDSLHKLSKDCSELEGDKITLKGELNSCNNSLNRVTEDLGKCEQKKANETRKVEQSELKFNQCDQDLKNCNRTVSKTMVDQRKMLMDMGDDLHYAGIYSTCCSERSPFRCNDEMLSARYTCLPIYLLKDVCLDGITQGQELWDILACMSLSDRNMATLLDESFRSEFIHSNPWLSALIIGLITFSILGVIFTFYLLIAFAFWLRRRNVTSSRQSLPVLSSGPPAATAATSGTEGQRGRPSGVSQTGPSNVTQRMNEDLRAAAQSRDEAFATVHEMGRNLGASASPLGRPIPPPRRNPPSYSSVIQRDQVRPCFAFSYFIHTQQFLIVHLLQCFLIRGGVIKNLFMC